MDYFKEKIEEIMNEYQIIEQKYIEDLKKSPRGSLIVQDNHGKDQFLQLFREDGVRKRHTITKDRALTSTGKEGVRTAGIGDPEAQPQCAARNCGSAAGV